MYPPKRVAFKSNNFTFWPTDDPTPSLIQSSSSSSSSDSSEAATKNPPVAFKPHKLLYPMRLWLDPGSTNNTSERAHDLPRTVWVGLAPLNMVESIVSLAEKSPELGAGLRGFLQCFLNRHENSSSDTHAGEKRKSDYIEGEILGTDNDDDDDDDDDADEMAEALVARYSDLQLTDSGSNAWKPSDTFGATEQVMTLDSLAETFEHLVTTEPKKKWIYPSYKRVQQACISQCSNNHAGTDAVLELATEKMRALFDMLSVEEHKAKSRYISRRLSAANTLLAMERPTTAQAEHQSDSRSQLHRSPSVQNSKRKKDVFQATMVAWLKNNFANPFPDDLMLHTLATHMVVQLCCITVDDAKILEGNSPYGYHRIMQNIAVEKISNWLVNQRTRKWRPSIELAFDQKRPAAMLLEDSLRLHQKKSLRPLVGWDGDSLFSFSSKYSRPIKKWKWKWHVAKSKTAKTGSDAKKKPESCVLSNATSPPPLDISPIVCSHSKRLVAAGKGPLQTSFASI